MNKKIYDAELSMAILVIPGIIAGMFMLQAILLFVRIGMRGALYPFFLACLVMLPSLIRFSYTKLSLYDEKIAGSIGFFRRKTLDAPLDKINDISISKNFLLPFGKITVSTSSSVFHFKGIANCEEFKNRTLKQIEAYKDKQSEEDAKKIARAMKMAQAEE